jgi:hypothetical protein
MRIWQQQVLIKHKDMSLQEDYFKRDEVFCEKLHKTI